MRDINTEDFIGPKDYRKRLLQIISYCLKALFDNWLKDDKIGLMYFLTIDEAIKGIAQIIDEEAKKAEADK